MLGCLNPFLIHSSDPSPHSSSLNTPLPRPRPQYPQSVDTFHLPPAPFLVLLYPHARTNCTSCRLCYHHHCHCYRSICLAVLVIIFYRNHAFRRLYYIRFVSVIVTGTVIICTSAERNRRHPSRPELASDHHGIVPSRPSGSVNRQVDQPFQRIRARPRHPWCGTLVRNAIGCQERSITSSRVMPQWELKYRSGQRLSGSNIWA